MNSPYERRDYEPRDTAYGSRTSIPPQSLAPAPPPRLNASRLWAGGITTAIVAALTAVVALLLIRGVLGIAVFAPESDGAMGNATTGALAGGAALAALVATALLHLLIAATPWPGRFFAWIIALVTAVMVLLPFTSDLPQAAACGTAAVYLAIGVAIGSLLSSVARAAVRTGRR
ncbi:DUF6069 family protein [Streptomyces sp. NPDC050145]|uniref:DUF6069 family protein n=1 Tax=Streptomyces sp. NPDC050145 TaxID=3365602 RepID=UPI003794E196